MNPPAGATVIEVLDAGVFTTVQDEGRPGFAHVAVSPSGAFDRPAFALANRIVGNRPGAPVLETVLGGLRLRLTGPVVVAVVGAAAALRIRTADGRTRDQPAGKAVSLSAGEEVAVVAGPRGLRSYLGFTGGLTGGAVGRPVLGSLSTDTLSGLGPRPLAAGDRLSTADWRVGLPAPDLIPLRQPDDAPVLDVLPGPRVDWLSDRGRAALTRSVFRVSDRSDRIGVRLLGPELERLRTDELASEALIVGAIQLPPGGEPIVFGPDHPSTGGYPVVAVVAERCQSMVAQLRPGQPVTFRWARRSAGQR